MAFANLPWRNAIDSLGSSAKRWLKGWFKYLDVSESITLTEMATPANPAADSVKLYAKNADSLILLNSAGVETVLGAAGTQNTLDQSYDQGGAGVGRVITVDQGAVQLNGSHATNDTFFVNKTTGSGDAIQITNAGTGKDIAGTSGTWDISKAGSATIPALEGVATINATTGNVVVGSGTGTVAINSSGLDLSAAGALSNATGLAFKAGTAAGISLAADGAADDLTVEVTGAFDSSLILQSAGTGDDAVKISASAGGVDIDALVAKDVDIAGGQVLISSKDDAASAIALTANVGTSETIVVTNTQGTGESAITLVSTAGGVNVDAAAAKDLDLAGGQVKLVSKDNAAGAISLTANIGTSETITVTNTKGTGAGAITLTATAGGITANVAAGKAITLNGTTNFKQGSNIASPAGGELDLGEGNFFYITGTNNITSIAAADSTAGRMVVLAFDGILTFTDGGNLKIAGNFVTSQDDTITLMCNGTNWFEVARSAN